AARRVAMRSPAFVQVPLRRAWHFLLRTSSIGSPSSKGFRYALRVAAEKAVFEGQTEVHDLPPIFHYWSNKHLRPVLESLGFSNPDEFFRLKVGEAIASCGSGPARIISIGSGNCDTEIRLAQSLIEDGLTH